MTIESKTTQNFEIQFNPTESKLFSQEIKLKIQNNHFENTSITVVGEAYQSDVTMENFPVEGEDELKFGECPVGKIYFIPYLNHFR